LKEENKKNERGREKGKPVKGSGPTDGDELIRVSYFCVFYSLVLLILCALLLLLFSLILLFSLCSA
jgi:hypothetical protein